MGKRAYFTAPTGADDGGKRPERWFLLTIRSLRCGRAAREAKFQTASAAEAAYCAAILGISDKSRYNAILLRRASPHGNSEQRVRGGSQQPTPMRQCRGFGSPPHEKTCLLRQTGFCFVRPDQTAASERSPVRMRMASSTGSTKILPSPILPERAVSMMTSMARSTSSSASTSSPLTLGRKSTAYSAPR